jgi:hypothetical protein
LFVGFHLAVVFHIFQTDSRFEFPTELDMSPYLFDYVSDSSKSSSAVAADAAGAAGACQPLPYHLYAVRLIAVAVWICMSHDMDQCMIYLDYFVCVASQVMSKAQSGHNCAFIRPTAREGESWFKLTDSVVRLIDEGEAVHGNFGGGNQPLAAGETETGSAQILFYVRGDALDQVMNPVRCIFQSSLFHLERDVRLFYYSFLCSIFSLLCRCRFLCFLNSFQLMIFRQL